MADRISKIVQARISALEKMISSMPDSAERRSNAEAAAKTRVDTGRPLSSADSTMLRNANYGPFKTVPLKERSIDIIKNHPETATAIDSLNAGVPSSVVYPKSVSDWALARKNIAENQGTAADSIRVGLKPAAKTFAPAKPAPQPKLIQVQNPDGTISWARVSGDATIPLKGGTVPQKSATNTNLQTIQVNDPEGKVDALGMPVKVPAVFNRKTGEATFLNVSPAKPAQTTTPARDVMNPSEYNGKTRQKPDGTFEFSNGKTWIPLRKKQ